MTHYRRVYLFEQAAWDPSSFWVRKMATHIRSHPGLVIAFSVDGKVGLEQAGIPCFFPDDLIDIPDLAEIGQSNLARASAICHLLDEGLEREFGILKEKRLALGIASFYPIKVFLDSVTTAYVILAKLFDHVDTHEIYVFRSASRRGDIFAGKAAILPFLIHDVFFDIVPHYRFIGVEPKLRIAHQAKTAIQSLLRCSASYLGRGVDPADSRDIALVLFGVHDIPFVIDLLHKQFTFYRFDVRRDSLSCYSYSNSRVGHKVNLKAPLVLQDKVTQLVSRILTEYLSSDPQFQNPHLRTMIINCLNEYWGAWVSLFIPHLDPIERMLQQLSPRFLLTAGCRLGVQEASLLELAKSIGLPIVTYQEGGAAGYVDWPLFNGDLEQSDYFLCYGSAVAASPFLNSKKAKMVPIGSIRLETIKDTIRYREKKRHSPTIFIVLDLFKRNTWQHYPYNNTLFSAAYRHQHLILEAASKCRDVHWVIKTTEKYRPVYADFAKVPNMSIETLPLEKILGEADAFILDWPSTVLGECLLVEKPIALLYDPTGLRFDRTALESLSQRIRICHRSDEIKATIEMLIGDIHRTPTQMLQHTSFRDGYFSCLQAHEQVSAFFQQFGCGI